METKRRLTQEYANRPQPREIKIACSKCRRHYDIQEALKERPLPSPHLSVVEGYFECPNCGDTRHYYYLNEQLRHMQTQVRKLLTEWHETKNTSVWYSYVRRQKAFQKHYYVVQERYRKIMEKEEAK